MPRLSAPTLEEHRETTWKRLRDSFLEALATEGYAALSIASVARRAGLARNTIYNYAPTKEALLIAVIQFEAEPFVMQLVQEAASVEDPEKRLALVIQRQMIAFVPGNRGLPVINSMQDVLPEEVSGSIAACFAPVFEIIRGILQQGISTGVFRPVADLGRVVEMMVGVVVPARRFVMMGEPVDLIANETTEFLLGALRNRGTSESSQPAVKGANHF